MTATTQGSRPAMSQAAAVLERGMNRSSATGHDRSTRATARRRGDLAPITYRRVPLLEPDTKLLAMGSCFAVEIHQALGQRELRRTSSTSI